MRKIPFKKSPRQRLLIQAVFDFYGEGLRKKKYRRAKEIALYLMGRRKGIELDEKQKEDIWYIKGNLNDKTYTASPSHKCLKIPQHSH